MKGRVRGKSPSSPGEERRRIDWLVAAACLASVAGCAGSGEQERTGLSRVEVITADDIAALAEGESRWLDVTRKDLGYLVDHGLGRVDASRVRVYLGPDHELTLEQWIAIAPEGAGAWLERSDTWLVRSGIDEDEVVEEGRVGFESDLQLALTAIDEEVSAYCLPHCPNMTVCDVGADDGQAIFWELRRYGEAERPERDPSDDRSPEDEVTSPAGTAWEAATSGSSSDDGSSGGGSSSGGGGSSGSGGSSSGTGTSGSASQPGI